MTVSIAGRSGGASRGAWPSRRSPPGRGARGGAPARLRAALGGFLRGTRAGTAIEAALSLSILVVAFAGLMQIVNTVFTDDRAGSAARAAARALALDPGADPWGPVFEELDHGAGHACTTDWTATDLGACAGWTLAVVRRATPAALAAALDPGTAAPAVTGDLVLVGLSRPAASIPGVVSANANASRTVEDLVKMDAIGVARSEPDA